MAKQFGPYSKYMMTEDGKFFGFDENDETLLSFKMSDEVKQAIQESFSLIKNEKVIGLLPYWPTDCDSTIEYYNEIFKNCEVIPNVYYMKNQFYAIKPSNGTPQNFAVSSSYMSKNTTPNEKTAFTSDFENSGDVHAINTSNGITDVSVGNPQQGNMTKSNIVLMCELAKKSDFSSLTTKPVFMMIDDLEPYYKTTWKIYKSLQSMYHTTGSIVDPFDVDSIYSLPQLKEKYAGMKTVVRFETYDNSADGSYSETNKRPAAGTVQAVDSNGNVSNNFAIGSVTDNTGLNSFVFFVKTFAPYYNDDGTIDDTKQAVQYWCFNIMALFGCQRWFCGQYSLTWCSRSFGKGVGGAPTLGRNYYQDKFFTGLGMFSESKNNVLQYFVPFPWGIQHNTRYFQNSVIVGDYNPQYSDEWTFELATQNGSSIGFFDETEMLDFLVNGLGLNATFNDDELRFKPVGDWEQDFPSGDVPGSGGQIGGLTGGGNGSGANEQYDDVGAPSSSTRSTYTQSSYILNEINMKHLQEAMVNDNLWKSITNMFKNNPQDGVINLIRFPIDFSQITTITNDNVKIVGVDISDLGETGFVRGTKIQNGMKSNFEIGFFDFPEQFGSFLDFDPYTNIVVYLPFAGFKQLSASAVVGRRLRIFYDIDYSDGSALITLRTSNKRTKTDFSNIGSLGYSPTYTFSCQVGQVIPLTQNNAQEKNQAAMKNGLLSLASIGIGAATGGAGGAAVSGIASATMNTASTVMDKTKTRAGGPVSSQSAYSVNDLTPFAIIDYPETNIPNGFQKYSGYITNLFQKMENMHGFTQFDNVKISGTNCLDSEYDELKSILEGGVIL